MALSVARFESDKITYKMVVETAVGPTTVHSDVTQDSGKIYSIAVENASAADHAYVKFMLSDIVSGITVGTTHHEMMIYAPSSSNVRITMPDGITFTKLSFWATNDSGYASTAAISSGNVKVSIVTS